MSVTDWLEDTRRWTESILEESLARHDLGPAGHAEAVRYALFGGGKRLRPALVRLCCLESGGSDADAAAPAVAVELVHTYSLVHDDLPCMDDDDLRRGRPTTHRVYGEAAAVLVGDSLQALAFATLARCGPRAAELTAILADGAGPAGMVGGQALDLAAGVGGTDADGVRAIHRLKTAALIAASAELGASAAGADAARRAAFRDWGEALGLCFQAIDDILDVTGSAGDLGKTPGKDAAAGKATLVAALGLEGAQAEAERLAETARASARAAGCGTDSLALGLVDYFLLRRS